ncbi:hypothetical protein K470DRAFT_109723 [Piedraia hortae CBS 480.64]|uniref:Uncharacterized protein n=1 Tax=Piedraia hortae CBS 480.64 TaxID=1314780 RepID=A0A6A7BWM4_9PEZI|nr:hypothetical protein K470DRAFT_109723 [Piedraia hortae CBS 480.64]
MKIFSLPIDPPAIFRHDQFITSARRFLDQISFKFEPAWIVVQDKYLFASLFMLTMGLACAVAYLCSGLNRKTATRPVKRPSSPKPASDPLDDDKVNDAIAEMENIIELMRHTIGKLGRGRKRKAESELGGRRR